MMCRANLAECVVAIGDFHLKPMKYDVIRQYTVHITHTYKFLLWKSLQVLNVSQEEKGEPPADSEEEQHAENKTEVTAPESLYAALTAALTTVGCFCKYTVLC